ncbi:hypothetical protein SAMN04488117_11852 [Celeribacter baekdonensis]|uniref:Uncharacterized protein n=1 Tax=Celeribacter baekdonensis TaxID=875171 RepID=A0A1G7TS71_9RHOB|nr:hypothetical protein [Celeribacter baekdonensis]SDG38118.1 hypothetical protein SAMN04488117_11852 [Celeribacter baekdonensis]|tara:strand:+ start:622 stop:1044 length:423 start_codon:yes stop_codon:yes gene_type:complete
MIFEFLPLRGVVDIEFGADRDAVRNILGTAYTSFKRTPLSVCPLDHFSGLGVFVLYDAQEKVEAFEFDDTGTVMFRGSNLVALTPSLFREIITDSAAEYVEDEEEIISRSLGACGWFPSKSTDQTQTAKSILIFKEGYFE